MIPDLVVDAAAAYRITRLVTEDDLLNEPRGAFVRWAYHRAAEHPSTGLQARLDQATGKKRRTFVEVERAMSQAAYDWSRLAEWSEWAKHDPDCPKLATLVTCRWCAGFWISLGVVVARRVAPRAWRRVAEAFALSAAAALVAGLEK